MKYKGLFKIQNLEFGRLITAGKGRLLIPSEPYVLCVIRIQIKSEEASNQHFASLEKNGTIYVLFDVLNRANDSHHTEEIELR